MWSQHLFSFVSLVSKITFVYLPGGCCDVFCFLLKTCLLEVYKDSEYVLVHKVTCGSVSNSCLGSNNRSSVPISGGRAPGDLAPPCDWLDRHCKKFTLEGAPQFLLFFFLLSFQLNVECSTLKGHSECVKICVCVFVCFHCMLLFFPSLLYQFYTEIFKWKPGYQLGWNPRPTFILSLTTVRTFQNKRRLPKNYHHSVSKTPCVK